MIPETMADKLKTIAAARFPNDRSGVVNPRLARQVLIMAVVLGADTAPRERDTVRRWSDVGESSYKEVRRLLRAWGVLQIDRIGSGEVWRVDWSAVTAYTREAAECVR